MWRSVQLMQGNTVVGIIEVNIVKQGNVVVFQNRTNVKSTLASGVNATIVCTPNFIPVDCRPKKPFTVQTPVWTMNAGLDSIGTFYVGGVGQFGFCPRGPNSTFGPTIGNGVYEFNTTWTLD